MVTASSRFEAPDFHPLELIPFFRRFPCSRVRNLVYTLIWNSLFAIAFLMLSMLFSGRLPSGRAVAIMFVLAHFIGFAIHALFQAGRMAGLDRWARRHGWLAKTVYFSSVPVIGVIAGFQAGSWIFGLGFSWISSPGWMIDIAGTSLLISLVLSSVFYLRAREAQAQVELEQERARTERMQREAVAANLRALQAQIEPHFLFNTLANVSTLVDRDPAQAKHMLERFIKFLRASLAATRTETTTLGAERDLIAAYLDVLSVRMGERLDYRVEVAADAAGFRLPPMLLQPVVENAIRHGLEPKVEGGRIVFDARRAGGHIVIEVRDTGIGFQSTTSGGVGLTNLRDRLRGLYGDAASLSIAENRPCGTVVTVRLPVEA